MNILPITAISLVSSDTILVAQGSHLSLLQEGTLKSKSVLSKGTIIHGISHYQDRYVVFGQSEFQVIELSESNIFTPFYENPISLFDWIISCHYLHNFIYILTIHNTCVKFHTSSGVVTESICSPIKSIVYSAHLYGHNFDGLIVAAGTVTNQILLWKPSDLNYKPDILIGHEGVIFSVHFNQTGTQLVSVSDDRTVRVWSLETEHKLIATLYGHNSRVWSAEFIPNSNDKNIFSISEDSTLKLWNVEKCEIIHTFVGHKGKSIWSAATSTDGRYVYTGGNDCTLRKWDLTPFLDRMKGREFCINNEVIRIVLIIDTNHSIVQTQSGGLWRYNTDTNKLVLVYNSCLFATYAVMALSSGRVALGGLNGDLVVMDVSHWNVIHQSNSLSVKILSLKWFSNYLIVSCQNGKFFIADFSHISVTLTHSFLLPPSNHRCVTSACGLKDGAFIVGDGKGSLHLYSNFSTQQAIFSINKLHGPNPITSLQSNLNFVYSTGRDGKLKILLVKDGKMLVKNSIQIYRKCRWLEGVYLDPCGTVLCVLFHGNEVLLVNARDGSVLVSVPCGGGHRGWDMNSFEEIIKGRFLFTYIKCQKVISVTREIGDICSHELSTPFLGREGLCVAILHTSYDTIVLAAGDETGTISIIKSSIGTGTKVLSTNQCHVGNICTMKVCEFENGNLLLFTAGGRGLLKAWEVNKSCLLNLSSIFEYFFLVAEVSAKPIYKQKHQNPQIDDFRKTTISILSTKHENNCVVFCGCSDGFIRSYHFSNDTFFTPICTTKHSNRCLLSSCLFTSVYPILLTAATDGSIISWKVCVSQSNLLVKTADIHCHQSGINSISVLNDSFLKIATIASVGDDNSICISTLYSHDTSTQICKKITDMAGHNSSIVSAKIFEFKSNNFLISVSRDERLKLFIVTETELELKLTRILDVTNISDMSCVVSDTGVVKVFVLGEGLEIVSFVL